MYAQDSDQETERFSLGQRLGDCLAKGCVVFTGVIQSLGALQKEPGEPDERRAVMTRKVDMKVGEWLYGPVKVASAQLIYAKRPEMSKTALGPWLAWEGATIEVGVQLLVVRWAPEAPRPHWMGQPEDVAFVVSDKSLFAPLREAIAQHLRFERAPGDAAKIPELLREKQDGLIRGYLLTYLIDVEGVRDVDKAAVMLTGLLSHPSLPEQGTEAIADWLASTFYRLAEPARKVTTEGLIVSASGDDTRSASPALSVLVRLGDMGMLQLKPLLTPTGQRKIVENYRTFQAKNHEPGHPEFETQLGIKR